MADQPSPRRNYPKEWLGPIPARVAGEERQRAAIALEVEQFNDHGPRFIPFRNSTSAIPYLAVDFVGMQAGRWRVRAKREWRERLERVQNIYVFRLMDAELPQTEPPMGAPPKHKRRWCQFSLRTLMIGVTLFCVVVGGYVGWQAKIVRDRKAELIRTVNMRLIGMDSDDQAKAIPWLRRVLGDVSVNSISMPPETTIDELDHLRALFPESRVTSDNRFDSPESQRADVQ